MLVVKISEEDEPSFVRRGSRTMIRLGAMLPDPMTLPPGSSPARPSSSPAFLEISSENRYGCERHGFRLPARFHE